MNLFDDQEVQSFLDWLDDDLRETAQEVVGVLKRDTIEVDSWDTLYNLVHSKFYQEELDKGPLILNANIQSTL